MLRTTLLLVPLLAISATSASQDKKSPEKKDIPKVLYSIPLVTKPGEKQKLALRGKGLTAVKDVKVTGAEGANVKVLSGKDVPVPNNYPGEKVGDSELEVELDLPKSAKPGEVKLIAVGPGGESRPYPLLLRDDIPAVGEKEPNDGFDQAQRVAMPSAIEGTIKGERDVDVFQFVGKKGDSISLEVQARRYGSPLDPVLTLYDANRRVIDSADDSSGKPDPALTLNLPRDGTYYVSVSDANDLGGTNFGYRLLIREK